MTNDGEAPKKSFTGAIKKSLSMFGFSADVLLGLLDDEAYVTQLKEKEVIAMPKTRAQKSYGRSSSARIGSPQQLKPSARQSLLTN